MTVHVLQAIDELLYLPIKSSCYKILYVLIIPFDSKNSKSIDVIVILNLFLKIVFQRIIERALFFEGW